MTNVQYFLLLIFGLFANTSWSTTESWSVSIEEDPVNKTNICLLVSRIYKIDDGQTTTPVQLIYNGKNVFAKTKSDIDMSYPNIGLQIDTHELHKISRVHKNNIVVFENADDSIHQQFINGRNAHLALGFWPTWPQTHTRIIDFSLMGYTETYKQFLKCRNKGKQP